MLFDPTQFDFTRQFEANWEPIRDEFLGLGRNILDIHRTYSHGAYWKLLKSNNGWMRSWQVGSTEPNGDWLTYGLCYKSEFPDEAFEQFPATAGLLQAMGKAVVVAGFSLLKGPTFILPHWHPELGGYRLTYHLGIQAIPGRCYLNVEGEFAEEREQKSIIFDGSREHFAINLSHEERVVLYIEFDRHRLHE